MSAVGSKYCSSLNMEFFGKLNMTEAVLLADDHKTAKSLRCGEANRRLDYVILFAAQFRL
jgi:hypothetical protein